jgi:hypothetical protein
VPDRDMVVVVTAGLYSGPMFIFQGLVGDTVLNRYALAALASR